LKRNPKNENTWYTKGKTLEQKGDLDAAFEAFEEVLQLNPKNKKALLNKEVISNKKGKRKNKTNMKTAFEWYIEGIRLVDKGMLHDALNAFDEVLKLNPKNEGAWNNKAVVLVQKGDLDGALLACDEALKINPKNEDAWIGKGGILEQKGDPNSLMQTVNKHEQRNVPSYEQLLALNPLLISKSPEQVNQLINTITEHGYVWNDRKKAFYSKDLCMYVRTQGLDLCIPERFERAYKTWADPIYAKGIRLRQKYIPPVFFAFILELLFGWLFIPFWTWPISLILLLSFIFFAYIWKNYFEYDQKKTWIKKLFCYNFLI